MVRNKEAFLPTGKLYLDIAKKYVGGSWNDWSCGGGSWNDWLCGGAHGMTG